MAALDEHVDGEHEVAARGWRDYGTIVADAYSHRRIADGAAEKAIDERKFVHEASSAAKSPISRRAHMMVARRGQVVRSVN
jgi:hypothetical protein